MVIVSCVRDRNTKPKFLAAVTRAPSSGDAAWYASSPERTIKPVSHGGLFITFITPQLYSGFFPFDKHFTITVIALHHDSMTEREQFEELCNIFVLLGSDAGNQGMIHELELSVSEPVPAPIHRLRKIQQKSYWLFWWYCWCDSQDSKCKLFLKI